MPEKNLAQVAFLGFAERSEQVRDAETVSLKWNVLGLKNVLLVNFLPIPLIGWKVCVAMRFFEISKPLKITLRAESGEDIGFLNLQAVKDNPTAESLIALSTSYGWFVAFAAIPPLVIKKQGRHFAILQRDDNGEDIIGEFYCHVVEPPPLTPERIAASIPSGEVIFKPAILTRFNADFAVVTPEKELVLIEIERAGKRLLKSDGGQHSDLTHAFDQIHNWLGVTRDHLLAVLDDSLHVPREMVSTVRGVVIAGRDLGYNASHLRGLKARYRGEIKFLTYDDLAASLATLAQSLGDR